jgi:methylisocitrate lyase
MQFQSGAVFRSLIENEKPLAIAGTINSYCALLAKQAGFKALYLSGAGVANAAFGLPDLGVINSTDLAEEARRITASVDCPLLVDVDTGGATFLTIKRTIRAMEQACVAAIHLEDQVVAKRCGHRPNKKIVSMQEMGDRIKAALDARHNNTMVIIARTDAYASYGINEVIERAEYFMSLGADAIFPDALPSLKEFTKLTHATKLPVLANMTEFGRTELASIEDLKKAHVAMVLYPLSAFRVMAKAAERLYEGIIKHGSQHEFLNDMQTREELYKVLDYERYEKIMDKELG